ncbi:MAG: ribosome silencing factor [Actinobacteria bacterium]|nr:ribosome silencing factor [Actinomycetota bacterium]
MIGKTLDSRELATMAAKFADEKKAEDVVILDVGKRLSITGYFVILSGINRIHVSSLYDYIEEKLRERGRRPVRIESSIGWILMDYFDIVVHIFSKELREFYCLERLWKDSEKLDWRT